MKITTILSVLILFAIISVISITPAFADYVEVTVEPATGSGSPGCETTPEGCFTPSTVTVDVGGKVIFSNTDSAAHTFTSGVSSDADSVGTVFDSSLAMAGSTFEWTATKTGEQPYFCIVHPWMAGLIVVESEEMMTDDTMMDEPKMQPHLPDVNLPINIPLTKGYVNGNEIFYISTEASVEDVTNHLADLTGFRVVYTPALAATPETALAQIYAFTNGVEGSGVFGFQPQVADSQPGDDKYSPLWNVNAVTWNDRFEPRELKSEMEIIDAKNNGELYFEEAGAIVNCPFVKWNGGQLQLRENSHVTDTDPYGGGQVLDIDIENMNVTFVAHRGFAPNGDTIYYIATDASSKDIADALGVVYVPKIQDTIATSSSSDLYVFTNGLTGNGPLGFQASIGSTTTGDQFYSPLWRIQTATWDDPNSADFLKSVSEITKAASDDKLETGLAGFVVNCPFVEVDAMVMDDKMMDVDEKEGGGCLIATAAYGSELAPQVQFLREIRDNTVMSTSSGTAFMTGFNQLYYSFAPTVADMERENPVFQQTIKTVITPMLSTLSIMSLADEGSEIEVLGFGISVIVLNLGMYIAVPALIGFKVHQKIKSRK